MTENATHPTPAVARRPSAERTLVRAQALAGALFFVFLVLHLSNTLLATFGADAYNSYQQVIRKIYQHPFAEIALVVGPLITHVIAGLWLHRIRSKRETQKALKHRLQTWTGFFLLAVVFGHMIATRGVSFWYGAFPEFGGVAFSLWWVPGYFYPYYFLLFMAGLYHGSKGIGTILNRAGLATYAGRPWLPRIVITLGAIGATLALLGFGGILFETEDPRKNDYARQYSKFFDIDLSAPRG